MLITILMIIFFRIFVSHIIFWTNLVPNSNVLQLDLNLIQGHIVILPITVLICNFMLVFAVHKSLVQISSQNLLFSIFTEI